MPNNTSKTSTRLAAGLVGLAKFPGVFRSFSKLGYQNRSKHFRDLAPSMAGKVVVITGANSGIGRSAAETLVSLGARVWLLCRDRARGESAVLELRSKCKAGGSVEVAIVDMSCLSSVRRVVETIRDEPIDVLIHNAGSLLETYTVTPEGLDYDFALHLAGPHLLTKLLLPKLQARKGRVLFVSSGGMYAETFSMNATRWSEQTYDGVRAYAVVKRGQVILASLWAEHAPSVEFHAMHPGWVDTPGVERSLPKFYRRLRRWLRTPAQGADTIVWLAQTSDIVESKGRFWLDRAVVPEHILPGTRESQADRDELWSTLDSLASEYADLTSEFGET